MESLTIVVNEDLRLDAGDVISTYHEQDQRDIYTITPPSKSMLQQIIDYLILKPEPPYIGRQGRYLGVAFVALTIRWGSYLAALMNSHFPPHSALPTSRNALQPEEISFITDREMMRLNLEISNNVAHLGRLYREDTRHFYDLLERAYHYLPMPAKSTRPNRELENDLFMAYAQGSVFTYIAQHPEALTEMRAVGLLTEDIDITQLYNEPVDFQYADRIIGNFLANFAWRNTEIENYHAGRSADGILLLPHQRRFTERDERLLLRELCGNGAAVIRQMAQLFDPKHSVNHPIDRYMAKYPQTALVLYNTHWKWFYSYPRHWSTTEIASPIEL